MATFIEFKYPKATNMSELHENFYQVISDNLAKRNEIASADTFSKIKPRAIAFTAQINSLQTQGFTDQEILKWGNFVISSMARNYYDNDNQIFVAIRQLIGTGKPYCQDAREVFGDLFEKEKVAAEKDMLSKSIQPVEQADKNNKEGFKI